MIIDHVSAMKKGASALTVLRGKGGIVLIIDHVSAIKKGASAWTGLRRKGGLVLNIDHVSAIKKGHLQGQDRGRREDLF